METTIDEIADGIYRLSTYIVDQDFMFNQFLVDGEDRCSSTVVRRGFGFGGPTARIRSPDWLRLRRTAQLVADGPLVVPPLRPTTALAPAGAAGGGHTCPRPDGSALELLALEVEH